MDIQENPKSYGHPTVTFSDEGEYNHFAVLRGSSIRHDIRLAFAAFGIAPIEFPYNRGVSHNHLSKVLGNATMFLMLGNTESPRREMDETFVREISGYYSSLGVEDEFTLQAEDFE